MSAGGVMTAYAIHPAADLMPMLGESDLAALAADIRANGLHEPVVMFDGQVLDGRNRLTACRLAGVEPTFRTLESCADPVGFVLSVNVRRRHLSTSQLAMVAGRVAISLEASGTNLYRRSREAAAEMVGGVGSQSAADAISVLKHGAPELIALVDRNDLAVSVAAKAAKFPTDQQRELVARGPDAVREAVKAEVKPREGKAPAAPSDTAAPSPTTTAPAAPVAGAGSSPLHPAPAPLVNLTSHPAVAAIASAPTRDALDAAYTAANGAGLSKDAAEEAGKVYQRRLSQLREWDRLTALRAEGERVAQDLDLTNEDADLGAIQQGIDEEAARRRSAREQAPAPTHEQVDLFTQAAPAAASAPRGAHGETVAKETSPAPFVPPTAAAEVIALRARVEALEAEVEGLRQWQLSTAARAGADDQSSVGKAMRLIALASSPNENEARNAAVTACRIIRERGLLVATSVQAPAQGEDSDELFESLRKEQADFWARMNRRVDEVFGAKSDR